MISYDTINLNAYVESVGLDRFYNELEYDVFASKYGKKKHIAKFDRLRATATDDRLFITGSASKFINGNNIQEFSRDNFKAYSDTICDFFEVQPTALRVSRLDLAVNIALNHDVSCYTNLLSGARYKSIGQFNDTIYLNSANRKICFYNKTNEVKRKAKYLQSILLSDNLLRAEFSIRRQLDKYLKWPEKITLNHLGDDEFLECCANYCWNEYKSIRILNSLPELNNVKSPKELSDYLIFKGVEALGYKKTEDFINTLKKEKIFKHPPYYTRVKNLIKEKINKFSSNQPNPLIEELNQKMEEAIFKNYKNFNYEKAKL